MARGERLGDDVSIKQALKSLVLGARSALPRTAGRFDVLLLCQNGLMADYLAPVWELFREDARFRFFVTFPRDAHLAHEFDKIRRQLPVREIRMGWAECRPWDLIVTADHGYAGLATRTRCPVLYTGHGMTGKVVAGEGGDYGYGPRCRLEDGSPRYSAMLEASDANRDRIIERDPLLAPAIRVVGSLQDDRLLSQLPRRDEIRSELGYTDEDCVVLVQSSWGPDSLVHTQGEAIFEAARKAKTTQFIASVHPHEYRPTADGTASWGERLRGFAGDRLRVREPSVSWIPSLVAADLVISDHTSLVIYAALAGKPTLWVPVPPSSIEAGTALARLRDMSPRYRPDGELEEQVSAAIRDFPYDEARALAAEINSCPGSASARIRALVGDVLALPDLAHEAPCARAPELSSRSQDGAPNLR